MRLHLIALPHVRLGTPTTHLCAYSGKVTKFCKMMQERYEIFLYAPEIYPVLGAQLVECLSDKRRIETFGSDEPNRLPAWPTDEQSREFNENVLSALPKLADQRDLVLLSGGMTHLAIKNGLPGMICCEPFCGYEGVIGGNSHVAFESYFHMAQVYAKRGWNDIRWYDRCIPPFVDVEEFPQVNNGKGDYLLFVGRLIPRKGPHIALQISNTAGLPLWVAGAGGRIEDGILHGAEGVRLDGDIFYHGPVGIEDRAKLMAGAKALIVPTVYGEPGGNVAIEAMMAGTPVIAPDWGVFSETIAHGVSGFHFRTLKQAVDAVNKTDTLDPEMIRAWARTHYDLESIAPKFESWFDDLHGLWGQGWNAL